MTSSCQVFLYGQCFLCLKKSLFTPRGKDFLLHDACGHKWEGSVAEGDPTSGAWDNLECLHPHAQWLRPGASAGVPPCYLGYCMWLQDSQISYMVSQGSRCDCSTGKGAKYIIRNQPQRSYIITSDCSGWKYFQAQPFSGGGELDCCWVGEWQGPIVGSCGIRETLAVILFNSIFSGQ